VLADRTQDSLVPTRSGRTSPGHELSDSCVAVLPPLVGVSSPRTTTVLFQGRGGGTPGVLVIGFMCRLGVCNCR